MIGTRKGCVGRETTPLKHPLAQAVKIGDHVETSSRGGWDDNLQITKSLADEIAQAFRNVERILATASAGWEHVVHVNSYHVGGFPGG